ncbi:MAG: tetratricopeptide repeat protein, partial [Planctomycetes bacterium]|nr:tetratricopeptide repeat protein [Planctomycetota bacterium]
DYQFSRRFSGFLRWPLLGFGAVAPLGFLGFLLCLRKPRRYFVPLLLVGIPFITLVAVFVLARYRLPAVPFLCLFAVHGLMELIRAIRSQKHGRAVLMLSLLITLFVVVHIPFPNLQVESWRGAANTAYAGYLLEKGETDQAMDELEIALTENPDDAVALQLRGLIHQREGRYESALNDFLSGAGRYPGDLHWVLKAGEVLTAMGRHRVKGDLFRKTVDHWEQSARQEEGQSAFLGRLLLELAEAEIDRGERKLGEETFRKALIYAPKNPDICKGLAALLVEDPACLEEALNLASRAFQIRPSPLNMGFLGWVNFKAGNADQAVELLEKALQKKPLQPQIQAWAREVQTAAPATNSSE